MTKEELNTHIEKRYSECCKRSQGLSYGSFYDGYVDCYCEQQKQVTELEDKLANADYQLEGRDNEIKGLKAQIEEMKRDVKANIRWADENKNNQMYCKLNAMSNQWELKEK